MDNIQLACCEIYSKELLEIKSKEGYILTNKLDWIKIKYHLIDGLVIIEGDIELGLEQDLIWNEKPSNSEEISLESVIFDPINIVRWPNKIVYYLIDPDLPNKERIHLAIQHWQSKTSMKFIERTTETNYVYFVSGNGCSSRIGMVGGKQNIRLAENCFWGNVVHEIAHAIGFWHEQSREDRDDYVTIHLENVKSGEEHNFEKHIIDAKDVGLYDYGSIMHYGKYAFSKNGKPTIEPKDPTAEIGQRESLSDKDIQTINVIYS
ncbi:M12 family metallopeptidase [Bacillus thuringiensis]|uniref:M12 family metallopeptidase n=1 Tax=Bacillus thuringiensis TaxID=1428 RepID=UPI001C3F14E1|nr:M12 family metallopeptidase [Bacillus thuringiensis]